MGLDISFSTRGSETIADVRNHHLLLELLAPLADGRIGSFDDFIIVAEDIEGLINAVTPRLEKTGRVSTAMLPICHDKLQRAPAPDMGETELLALYLPLFQVLWQHAKQDGFVIWSFSA